MVSRAAARAAFWSKDLGEFVLPYAAVREAPDPDATLMAFLESTFAAAAQTGNWNLAGQSRRHYP